MKLKIPMKLSDGGRKVEVGEWKDGNAEAFVLVLGYMSTRT